MQKLHLVGFTPNFDGLILSTRKGAKSGSFVVSLDQGLLKQVADAERMRDGGRTDRDGRLSSPRLVRPESALSPREMQDRIRTGWSIDEVAAEAGVDLDWVSRFASPVLAEMQRVLDRARAATFEKPRVGMSGLPLGAAVRRNVMAKAVRLDDDDPDDGWLAFQLDEEQWVVRYVYRSRGRAQQAEWLYDTATGELVSRNRLGSQLGYVARPRVRRATPDPGPRTASSTAPRKPAARKTAARKTAARKTTARKTAARKTTARKSAARKTTARKPAVAKAGARKTAAGRKTAGRAAPARKVAARKAPAKKAPARAAGRSAATKRAAAAPRTAKRAKLPATPPPAPTAVAPTRRAELDPVVIDTRRPAAPPARSFVPAPLPVAAMTATARAPRPTALDDTGPVPAVETRPARDLPRAEPPERWERDEPVAVLPVEDPPLPGAVSVDPDTGIARIDSRRTSTYVSGVAPPTSPTPAVPPRHGPTFRGDVAMAGDELPDDEEQPAPARRREPLRAR